MIVTRTCLHCSKEISVRQTDVNRGQGKFCSISCSSRHYRDNRSKPGPNVTCAYCHKRYYLNSSKQKNSKSGLFFCCREHKDISQRIGGLKEIQPSHYGDQLADYRELAFRSVPNECAVCSYSKFREVLVVHHRDRDRSNNSLANLVILCPTHHIEEHFLGRDGQFWKMA